MCTSVFTLKNQLTWKGSYLESPFFQNTSCQVYGIKFWSTVIIDFARGEDRVREAD